jgi:hypothetical protein
MRKTLGVLADRLVGHLVPKTVAGACPCGDVYYQFCYCNWATGAAMHKRCQTNCDCSVTTCGGCSTPIGYCP